MRWVSVIMTLLASARALPGEASGSDVLSVSTISCNATMKLACVVTLGVNEAHLAGESMAVSLHYYPEGKEYLGLWTPPLWVNASVSSLDVAVFRLRPSTWYAVEVYGQKSTHEYASPAPLLKTTIFSPATGYDLIDDNVVGTIISGNPSFSVMMFDIESDDFKGVVMVDREGYPVWYHDAGCQVRSRASPLARARVLSSSARADYPTPYPERRARCSRSTSSRTTRS